MFYVRKHTEGKFWFGSIKVGRISQLCYLHKFFRRSRWAASSSSSYRPRRGDSDPKPPPGRPQGRSALPHPQAPLHVQRPRSPPADQGAGLARGPAACAQSSRAAGSQSGPRARAAGSVPAASASASGRAGAGREAAGPAPRRRVAAQTRPRRGPPACTRSVPKRERLPHREGRARRLGPQTWRLPPGGPAPARRPASFPDGRKASSCFRQRCVGKKRGAPSG